MPLPVSLHDMVEQLTMTTHGMHVYLNTQTGELVSLNDEELAAAEEDSSVLYAFDEPAGDLAKEVLSSGQYIQLPGKWDLQEHRIMESFAQGLKDTDDREELLQAISKQSSMRFFRELVAQFNLQEDWYEFRRNALANVAVHWLRQHDVEFVADLPSVGQEA